MVRKLLKRKGETLNLDFNSLTKAREDCSDFIKHDYYTQKKLGLTIRSIEADVFELTFLYMQYFNDKKLAYAIQREFDFCFNEGTIIFCLSSDFFCKKLYVNKSAFYKSRKVLIDLGILEKCGYNGKIELYKFGNKIWEVMVEGKDYSMARRPDRNKTAGMEKAGVEIHVDDKPKVIKTSRQRALAFVSKIQAKAKEVITDPKSKYDAGNAGRAAVKKFLEDINPTEEELELYADFFVFGWHKNSVLQRKVSSYFSEDGRQSTMENAREWDKAGRPKERPSKFKNTNQNIGKGSQLSDEEKAEYIKKYRGGK